MVSISPFFGLLFAFVLFFAFDFLPEPFIIIDAFPELLELMV